jgi:hypothetical protein
MGAGRGDRPVRPTPSGARLVATVRRPPGRTSPSATGCGRWWPARSRCQTGPSAGCGACRARAQTLVERHESGVRVGAELISRRPPRVGLLQRMPALHAPAAAAAGPDVDRELAVDRLAGDLGLVLPVGVCFLDVPAPTGRTRLRQRGLVPLIDLLGRRGTATGVAAISPPLLATRLLRLSRRSVPLAEGSSPPLAGPPSAPTSIRRPVSPARQSALRAQGIAGKRESHQPWCTQIAKTSPAWQDQFVSGAVIKYSPGCGLRPAR